MKPRLNKEFIKEVYPHELPEIERLALLLQTASKAEISEAGVMPGGLTNRNFKVTLSDGTKVAVRIAGQGTAEYMNRPAEKHNATLMSSLGINAEIYYFDVKSGSQLCQFLDGDTMHSEDFRNNHEILKKSADIMRKYHNSGFEFADVFSPFMEIMHYNKILVDNNFTDRFAQAKEISDKIVDVMEIYAENPPQLVPCHNDPLSENFMYVGERLYLIDWEYAGMNDRFFDLAAIINENELDVESQEIFLKQYFQDEVTEEQWARVHISRFVADAMWAIWSLVQISNGKDEKFYRNYGNERVEQCLEFIKDPNWDKYMKLLGKTE